VVWQGSPGEPGAPMPIRDPKARVLLALARHAEAFGEECELGLRVRTTTSEIAREVAVDEKLARDMMKRIHRLGIAEEQGEFIIVTELARLQDFLEFLETARAPDASVPPLPSSPGSSSPGSSSPGSSQGGTPI
jgi:hypothetical protein